MLSLYNPFEVKWLLLVRLRQKLLRIFGLQEVLNWIKFSSGKWHTLFGGSLFRIFFIEHKIDSCSCWSRLASFPLSLFWSECIKRLMLSGADPLRSPTGPHNYSCVGPSAWPLPWPLPAMSTRCPVAPRIGRIDLTSVTRLQSACTPENWIAEPFLGTY